MDNPLFNRKPEVRPYQDLTDAKKERNLARIRARHVVPIAKARSLQYRLQAINPSYAMGLERFLDEHLVHTQSIEGLGRTEMVEAMKASHNPHPTPGEGINLNVGQNPEPPKEAKRGLFGRKK